MLTTAVSLTLCVLLTLCRSITTPFPAAAPSCLLSAQVGTPSVRASAWPRHPALQLALSAALSACVPARWSSGPAALFDFYADEYLYRKSSSTVATAINVGSPLLAEDRCAQRRTCLPSPAT